MIFITSSPGHSWHCLLTYLLLNLLIQKVPLDVVTIVNFYFQMQYGDQVHKKFDVTIHTIRGIFYICLPMSADYIEVMISFYFPPSFPFF